MPIPQYNQERYGRHISNESMYRDAVRNLNRTDRKGSGEQYEMADIMSRSNVNFNNEMFTPYDYAYMVNALKSDYPDISERPEQYMQMANRYLHNDNFPVRGEERAYNDYQNRSRRNELKYNYQNYQERNTYRDRDNDNRYNE